MRHGQLLVPGDFRQRSSICGEQEDRVVAEPFRSAWHFCNLTFDGLRRLEHDSVPVRYGKRTDEPCGSSGVRMFPQTPVDRVESLCVRRVGPDVPGGEHARRPAERIDDEA